ncbi:MAG TPA: VTT domain-containing protein [Candidatus Woesebacteria bacterium]|nr:VTT domain-containing protein [Candidatus Woesebacteria bacterium]HPJ17468.1 VTT domain-containing protein [Candidatus Woesebacteria bacterium]
MKEKLKKLFKSKVFKKVTLIIGVIFIILTFILVLRPEPFIKLGYWGVLLFGIFGPSMAVVPRLALEMNLVLVAIMSALGMAINDSVTWWVGKVVGDEVIKRTEKIEKIEKIIKKFGLIAILGWSFIPFPYDLIGLIAGYLEVSFVGFLGVTFLGRLVRFLLIGAGVVGVSKMLY